MIDIRSNTFNILLYLKFIINMGDYKKCNRSYCKHLPRIKVTVKPNFQTQTFVDTYFSHENNTDTDVSRLWRKSHMIISSSGMVHSLYPLSPSRRSRVDPGVCGTRSGGGSPELGATVMQPAHIWKL